MNVSIVASFTDAWIETLGLIRDKTFIKSHLLQMRGLKHIALSVERNKWRVASFTDAWIETRIHPSCNALGSVASFTDAWIETAIPSSVKNGLKVASFTDAWIETLDFKQDEGEGMSHLLQMRGLKLDVF